MLVEMPMNYLDVYKPHNLWPSTATRFARQNGNQEQKP